LRCGSGGGWTGIGKVGSAARMCRGKEAGMRGSEEGEGWVGGEEQLTSGPFFLVKTWLTLVKTLVAGTDHRGVNEPPGARRQEVPGGHHLLADRSPPPGGGGARTGRGTRRGSGWRRRGRRRGHRPTGGGWGPGGWGHAAGPGFARFTGFGGRSGRSSECKLSPVV